MSDPTLLRNLAERNLASGDLAAALRCLEQAHAAGGADPEQAARLAEACRSGAPDLLPRAQGLVAQVVGVAPATPARSPEPRSPEPREGARQPVPSELNVPALGVLRRLLSAGLDLEQTGKLALDLVAEASGAERAHLILSDAHRTAFGWGEGPARPPATSSGVIEEALQTRATVVVQDGASDPRFADRESVRQFSIRSVLCAPVSAGSELVGVLYVSAGRPAAFGARHLELVESLAELLGPPLQACQKLQAQSQALAQSQRELRVARDQEKERQGLARLLGQSAPMVELRQRIERLGAAAHAVLVTGESGSGKELVARALHEASPRAEGPFVAENVAALNETLLESLLFGHVRGAFSGAETDAPGLFRLAHGGTLFLDEIGELAPRVQAKLLRAVAEGELRPVGSSSSVKVDVRLLTATHRDLQAAVRAGTFRADLYYRLSVLTLPVPPLRERGDDIDLLLEHFLTQAAAELGLPVPYLPPELVRELREFPWPGNVRQLRNYAARLLLTGPLPKSEAGASSEPTDESPLQLTLSLSGEPLPLREARAAFDKAYLRRVLREGQGIGETATALGIHRSYLSQLLTKHQLRRP